MLVSITRDCQISGVFYSKWKQVKIDPSLFQSDSMTPILHKPTKETDNLTQTKNPSIQLKRKKQRK